MRPLRPGPRINLAARGRGASSTTTTTEAPVEDHVTGDEEPQPAEVEASEKVYFCNFSTCSYKLLLSWQLFLKGLSALYCPFVTQYFSKSFILS